MTITYISIAFLVVNLFSLLLMGVDKQKAIKGKYRISEKALFLSALPFSSYGFTIGMKLFKHKTQKIYFKMGSYVLMILHTSIILYILKTYASFDGIFDLFQTI